MLGVRARWVAMTLFEDLQVGAASAGLAHLQPRGNRCFAVSTIRNLPLDEDAAQQTCSVLCAPRWHTRSSGCALSSTTGGVSGADTVSWCAASLATGRRRLEKLRWLKAVSL